MKFGSVRSPLPTSPSFFFHVGAKIRAMTDWYPARAGAIANIIHLEGMPGNYYAVVRWEDSFNNFSPYPTSEVWPADSQYFEKCS